MKSNIQSPRIQRIARQLAQGNSKGVLKVLADIKRHGPLVEAHPRSQYISLVTFIYRGNTKTRRVSLTGGPMVYVFPKPLVKLKGTQIWYRTEELPTDSRFSYGFQLNHAAVPNSGSEEDYVKWMVENPAIPDPLYDNSYHEGLFGRTAIELPGAPEQIWGKKRPGTLAGRIADHKIYSHIQRRKHSFRVYVPAAYSEKTLACDVLVIFDGQDVDDKMPLPTVLDNLWTTPDLVNNQIG